MRQKSILIMAVFFITTLLFVGCSNDPPTSGEPTPTMTATNPPDDGITIPEETKAPSNIKDISSKELVSQIKLGWNLGNTLDATGGIGLMSETSWGNPKTSKEMIDKVKEGGFNAIRIPVSWGTHMGAAPDYVVHKVWLDRVKEVVDYALANDMYVIINTHHEEWYFPDRLNLVEDRAQLTALWTQVATYFESYDEHLIFEGLNEPRLRETSLEWNGGDTESREVVNILNQTFVDAVLSTGGNNTLRHLIVPTYAASSDVNAMKEFKLPTGTDKIIVSIHAYLPYNFALNKTGTDQFDITNSSDTADIDYLFKNIDTYFLSQGIPTIIGEFGSMNKDNLEARVQCASYYVGKAKEYGVPCFWWDNNLFSGEGENFGLFDRRTLEWGDPEILDALMKAVE